MQREDQTETKVEDEGKYRSFSNLSLTASLAGTLFIEASRRISELIFLERQSIELSQHSVILLSLPCN